MLRKKETYIYAILFFTIGVGYVESTKKMQGMRDRLDPTQILSTLHINPKLLELVTGEFRYLWADYLFLKSSIYLGGRGKETPEVNKKTISMLFRQSANLDPYFFQTCYFTQAYLPWWKGKYVLDAIEILKIFKQHRDWDWQPGFFIGFGYHYFMKDDLTASHYLMEASKLTKAPPLVGHLGARLHQREGHTQASITFLKTMLAAEKRKTAKKDIKFRIKALEGILILEKAIAQFKSMFSGQPPDSLDRLVEAGILKTLPKNPTTKDGLYQYKDGQIDF